MHILPQLRKLERKYANVLQVIGVHTLAGTGEQGHERHPDAPGRSVALSSPWDLALQGDRLFIAMAGTHQIWQLDLRSGHISVYAGSGAENLLDGSLTAAQFAQPSGLALWNDTLYVADTYNHRLKRLNPQTRAASTWAGNGFPGYRDGTAAQAQFREPSGLSAAAGKVFVADTNNHVIRVADGETGEVGTLEVTGIPQVLA